MVDDSKESLTAPEYCLFCTDSLGQSWMMSRLMLRASLQEWTRSVRAGRSAFSTGTRDCVDDMVRISRSIRSTGWFYWLFNAVMMMLSDALEYRTRNLLSYLRKKVNQASKFMPGTAQVSS